MVGSVPAIVAPQGERLTSAYHLCDTLADWSALLIGGNNGIICILMSLYWWGKCVPASAKADLKDWLDAVKEVDTVFSVLNPEPQYM